MQSLSILVHNSHSRFLSIATDWLLRLTRKPIDRVWKVFCSRCYQRRETRDDATVRSRKVEKPVYEFCERLLRGLQPETGFFYTVTDSWISRFWHAKSRFVAEYRIECSNPKGGCIKGNKQTLKWSRTKI